MTGVLQEPGGHWKGLKNDRDMITKGLTVAQLMGKMMTKGMQTSQLGKPWEKFMEAYPGRDSMLLRELTGFVSFRASDMPQEIGLAAGRHFEIDFSDAYGNLKQSVPPSIQLAVHLAYPRGRPELLPNATKLVHSPATCESSTTFVGGNPAWSVMRENIGTNRQTVEKQCIAKATSAIKAYFAETRKPYDHFCFFVELQVHLGQFFNKMYFTGGKTTDDAVHDGEDQPPAKRTKVKGQKKVTDGVVDEDIKSSEYPASKNATGSNPAKGRVTRSRARGKKN